MYSAVANTRKWQKRETSRESGKTRDRQRERREKRGKTCYMQEEKGQGTARQAGRAKMQSQQRGPIPGGTPISSRYPQQPPPGSQPVGQPPMRRQMAPPPGPLMQNSPMPQPGSRMQPSKKKRRYADKLIAPKVRELVPESQAYMDLLAFEQKLDATITRKKLDIQESLKRPQKIKRRLRIYISHTFLPGREPEREGEEGAVPMWELRVEGRLLDEINSANAASGGGSGSGTNPTPQPPPARPPSKRKFSSFFKSLVIELDKEIYGPDNHLVEWHRTPTTNETDGFQVKRPGDRPVKCTILLLLDYQPMKFKLHPRLAKVLGIAAETRPKIIEALWQYIKTHKLQDPNDRDTIVNDVFLEQCFGTKKMRFMEIPQRLHQLLTQPDPLVLHHIIQHNEGGAEKNTECYDIDVEVEDPLKQHMAAFVHSQQSAQEIANLDQKIYDIVEQINEWKIRRDFYARFADSPHDFIEKWLMSQSADLKTMTESNGDTETDRKVEAYFKPDIEEGVFRYLYQKVQQKRAELEQSLGKMTPKAPTTPVSMEATQYFLDLFKQDATTSTGLAAIKTLHHVLENSRASTVVELEKDLEKAVQALLNTDCSSTTIRSASDLFKRFISLAPSNVLEQPIDKELEFYESRGRTFIASVGESRSRIAKYSRPFFKSGMNVLTHSHSLVVLEALSKAHSEGVKLHVWVAESQPDGSGKLMFSKLQQAGLTATLVLDSAVGYLMERIDMVAVGAEGVMETGGIINKIGTLNVCTCAKALNKPVYVMAESFKFVKEYPLSQRDIPLEFLYRSSTLSTEKDLSQIHPLVDYTAPHLINLLFTDIGILTPAAIGEELVKLYI
ncbi:hypothetical protein WR25_00946 [Diploscapter pachys]|uniref:Translation initiation factor eIF2B subunit alpha n=1 Tax=Diploscapter pachys TaxID=2018661 RepID=A0A2A2LIR1_9BILA|nr:hypothetical protein WR25_00946 [Diploscapter pachys]